MPLKGIKVLEFAGLAPAPFCGMILAEFGASVIKIDKTSSHGTVDSLGHGKRSIAVNLKTQKGSDIVKKLSKHSDVVIEPFRPGVMERMKLGPEDLLKINEKLIYARLTGFGQSGPYANMAGHDINYLGLSGLLSLFGRHNQKPTPPVNLAADFGGGGLMCAFGIILALFERGKSNCGQVIDTSMVEGSAYLGSWLFRSQNMPLLWGKPRGENVLDSGTHFYDTYETKDKQYMCVGALEPQFYEELLEKLGLPFDKMPQFENFEENRKKLEQIFKQKTRAEWCEIFDGTNACVTPVLSLKDVALHTHNKKRDTFITENSNVAIPNPTPRLSRTPGISKGNQRNPDPGEHTIEILTELNLKRQEISNLIATGIVSQAMKPSML